MKPLTRAAHAAAGLALAAALLLQPAAAHDTWFAARPGPLAGHWQLALGTGDRFPLHEFTLTAETLRAQGCRQGDVAVAAPQPLRVEPTALQMQLQLAGGARRGRSGAVSCWAELQALDIGIEPAKVERYLDEIAAPPALRAAWADQRARGVPWRERYRKHARIELLDRRVGGGDSPAAPALPMAMDIVLDSGLERLHAGDEIRLRVLRDGRALPAQAIELRHERSAIGLWLRTDAQGRAAVRVPLAGSWLLRGTELRLSERGDESWDSWFVTLAFEVAPRPR